jgi:biotin transport system substrate-specific component
MSVAPQDEATTAAALPTPTTAARSTVTTDLALVATFAAFIAVCAILPGIPTGTGVPITLQTFGVILAGLVLGARRGTLAVLLYLVVGFAGLPVFSGGVGGLAVLGGPSVGYLLAVPFGAALAGALAALARRVRPRLRPVALFAAGLGASLLTIHPAGIAGMMWRLDLTVVEAVVADARYLPGDVVKNVAAALVAVAVFRAFPELLRARR